jgi:DNA adenine methylase
MDRRTSAGLGKIAEFFEIEVEHLWREKAVSLPSPRSDRSLIRWIGTKRVQASEIVTHFPQEIATYYEPFLGGGAVLHEILKSGISVKRYRCSDKCAPLIELWRLIKADPAIIARRYEEMHWTLRRRGKDFYCEVRERFNRKYDPCDFFFVLRTCRNAWVRFNTKGHFNVGFHHNRKGVPPHEVHALLQDWHSLLVNNDVRFAVRDYRDVRSRARDVLYLDPPYSRPDKEIYSGMFDFEELWKWMRRQRATYILSLSGFVNGEDRRMDVPSYLYDDQLQIEAGTGSLNTKGRTHVTNTLYVRLNWQAGS